MTEIGKKWAYQQNERYENYFASVVGDAEFWLRAFCDEVEKRAEEHKNPLEWFHNLGWSMKELKRELLGDDR